MKILNDMRALARPAFAAIAGILSALALSAHADVTTISPSPIASTRSAQVKPNIMLLMDASSSMGYSHMPDEVEDKVTPISVGYKNYLCNSLYYKPGKDYSQVPRTYDGTEFAANLVTFTRAPFDIFVNGTSDWRDLSNNFRPYENGITTPGAYSLKQPDWPDAPANVAAYYYNFVPTNAGYTIDFNSAVCANADTGASRRAIDGNGQDVGAWQRVLVGAGEQQNFANWYAYYRNRMLMTKTAASRAFNAINSSRRVGFITVEPNRQDASPYNLQSTVQPEKFLALNDFTIQPGGQREKWYAKLFAQKPKGFSPAREGLARVGRYYGNKFDGINQGMGGVDPMQYSCQQNFTIMTTDGYWNVRTESTNALLGGSFRGGPVQLDGITLVGNQDGNKTGPEGDTPPGIWDSSLSERRTTTDRLDTWSDIDCTGTGTFLKKTQTLSSSRPYTLTTSNTKRTRDQLESNTFNYTKKVEHFETQTRQYRLHSEQYFTQTLNYTLNTTQKTRHVIPFTPRTDTLYTQSFGQQLQELDYNFRATKKYYTKQVFELHQTGVLQWYKTVSKQTLTRSQYTKEVTHDEQRVYHCNSLDGTDEHGTLSSTCVPSQGVQIKKIYDLPNPPPATTEVAENAWYAVPKGTCGQGFPTGSPRYQIAECRTVTDYPSQGQVSCTPGTVDGPGPNYQRTVCNLTVLESLKPVPSCTNGTTQLSQSQGYEIQLCETTYSSPRALMADPSQGCLSGQSGSDYVTTTCEHGPLWSDLANSGVCTNPGLSGSPDYTFKVCNNQGPTTTYIPASANCQPGNFGSCTPGIVDGPNNVYYDVYAGGCTTGEVNNSPATAASYTNQCTGTGNSYNYLGTFYVAACHYPANMNMWKTDPNPPYGIYYCYQSLAASAAAPSAACTSGTTADATFRSTTCSVTGPTTTYVFNCQIQDANSSNGGRTSTCGTKPAEYDLDDDGSCVAGDYGSGSGAYRLSCGGRSVAVQAVVYCVPGSTTDLGGGQSTTCQLTQGGWVASATSCTPGNYTNPNGPDFTGYACRFDDFTTDGVIPRCTVGTVMPDNTNQYKKSVCTIINPGAPQSIAATAATCSSGSPSVETQVGATSTYSLCSYTLVQNTAPYPGTCSISATPTFDGTNSTTCGGANQTPWAPIASCDLSNGGVSQNLASSPYQVTNCRQSSITGVDYVLNPTDCVTATSKNSGNSYTLTSCLTNTQTNPSPGACTPGLEAPPTPGNMYMHTTCNVGAQSIESPANCSPGSTYDSGTGLTTTCRKIDYAAGVLTNCTAGTSSTPTATDWITDVCYSQAGVAGKSRQYTETETVLVEQYSGNTLVSALAPVTNNVPGKVNVPTDGVCHIPALNPLTPLPVPARPTTGMPNGCQSWACVASVPLVGGSYNSLADVAQYYYKTDLRPDMRNDGPYGVPHKSDDALDDRLPSQHMTTFTIALGVSGVLNYIDNYRSSATGDFADIKAGTKAWPIWPLRDPLNPANIDPAYYTSDSKWDDPRSIDDFWHTAVDGRGQYFSARDPNAVANGVTSALLGIDAAAASGSSVGYTTLEPVAGDNAAYVPYYQTYEWTGDVKARTVNLSNGTLGTTDIWSAADLLNQRTGAACDTRQIYLLRGGASPALTNFTWNTSTCNTLMQPAGAIADGLNSTEQAFFSDSYALRNLSQYPQMTTGSGNQRESAAGAALVNFLRGQTGKEQFQAGDNNKLFRTRSSRLGDIIDAQPMYVKTPFASYQDTDYIAFKAEKSSRLGMLYVAANDGMLHAFRATVDTNDQRAGQEEWAVIPSTVLPNLYKLADDNYRNQHQFFVNATPTIGDVRDTTKTGTAAWSTILVGGLGDGGAGFYALDVTDPLVPKALWEFKFSTTCYDANSDATKFADCNLGLSYSKPIITKLSDGTGKWVVMFTSGYNNVQAPGDGKGYLYVLDALTGKIKFTLSQRASAAHRTPSNLGQINNFVDDAQSDNSTLRVYGGDMYGKLWRFNVNGTPSATLIGTLKDPSDVRAAHHYTPGAGGGGRQATCPGRHRPPPGCTGCR